MNSTSFCTYASLVPKIRLVEQTEIDSEGLVILFFGEISAL